MPIKYFTESERKRLDNFPAEIQHKDLVTFFTLSASDKKQIPIYSAPYNRLGFALQLCTIRFLGFVPDELTRTPSAVVEYLAHQLNIDASVLSEYPTRVQTRTDHLMSIMEYLDIRKASEEDVEKVTSWLVERALEHDKPSLLYELICDKLRADKILRPGITSLERVIAEARHKAETETILRMESILTDECKSLFDSLLKPEREQERTLLSQLRQRANSNSPPSILRNIDKLNFLKEAGILDWNLDNINPNRLKRLAQIARKSRAQALRRAPEGRRYPVIVAFLHQSLVDITDETIDMFDRCLADAYSRAGNDLDDVRKSKAKATNEKVLLFHELGTTILDEHISDLQLRNVIYQRIPKEKLQAAVDECDELIRPLDDNYFDFLESRYSYIRQFAPAFLCTFTFQASPEKKALLEAIELLRSLNAECRRKVPEDAPVDFVPPKWLPYVIDEDNNINRHYYELCALWELRNALRSGDVWQKYSRRYANPETYLIPKDRWPEMRAEVCRQIAAPQDGTTRLKEREVELEEMLAKVDTMLSSDDKVRIDNGELVVSPLEADERPESLVALEERIDRMLPRVQLTNLLIEVDNWTKFSQHFVHPSGYEPHSNDFLQHLYASILAQRCNIDFARMALSASLSDDRLFWLSNWYIREETLRAATDELVNFHYHQPLSYHWGGGTLSSSDGQRFPASGKVRIAEALPRYFGYGKGVTFYTWTSDQYSQYGTKVIPATVRDATYVLDEILDNETELSIMEHTTDTMGYTEIVFALFDLLGMQFSPRIRDLGDQHLYQLNPEKRYPNLQPLLKGNIKRDIILKRWDDFLRVAGSLKMGWVTASLFISKLKSYPRQNALARALQEHGRLVKTIFILRYLENEQYRRRILTQINKGEKLHDLRKLIFFANQGKIRRKQEEGMSHQAACLNLITNAVVVWNTVYMNAAIEQLKAEGYPVYESDIKRLSPARHEHINPYGRYIFEVEKELSRKELRTLRK